MAEKTTITLALDSEELTNLMSNLPLDVEFLQWLDIECTHFEKDKAIINFGFDAQGTGYIESLLGYCICEMEGRKSVFDKGMQMVRGKT